MLISLFYMQAFADDLNEEELGQQIRDEQLRIAKAVQSKRLAEQTYYQCILDNLKNTNSKESIELLKQTCRNIAKTMEHAKKKPSDLSDEELCLSLGYEFDKSELKCK